MGSKSTLSKALSPGQARVCGLHPSGPFPSRAGPSRPSLELPRAPNAPSLGFSQPPNPAFSPVQSRSADLYGAVGCAPRWSSPRPGLGRLSAFGLEPVCREEGDEGGGGGVKSTDKQSGGRRPPLTLPSLLLPGGERPYALPSVLMADKATQLLGWEQGRPGKDTGSWTRT